MHHFKLVVWKSLWPLKLVQKFAFWKRTWTLLFDHPSMIIQLQIVVWAILVWVKQIVLLHSFKERGTILLCLCKLNTRNIVEMWHIRILKTRKHKFVIRNRVNASDKSKLYFAWHLSLKDTGSYFSHLRNYSRSIDIFYLKVNFQWNK